MSIDGTSCLKIAHPAKNDTTLSKFGQLKTSSLDLTLNRQKKVLQMFNHLNKVRLVPLSSSNFAHFAQFF